MYHFKLKTMLSSFIMLCFLTACLNDDDDPLIDPTPSTNTETTQVTVTPSLGLIKNADVVVTRLSDGTEVSGATGNTGETGTVTLSIPNSVTGPFVFTVKGSNDAQYFDEAKGQFVGFDQNTSLRAIISTIQQAVGITTLTEIAATTIENSGKTDADTVNDVNEEVRKALAPGLSDITQPPQLVDENTENSITNDEAGVYAATLAALANLAKNSENPAIAVMNNLRADFLDKTIDGKVGEKSFETPVYDAGQFISDLSSAITNYVEQFGTSELKADISETFSLNNLQKTLSGLADLFENINLDDIDLGFLPDGLVIGNDEDDDNDEEEGNDSNNDNEGQGNTLTITGKNTTAGITVEIPKIVVENVPAPNPEDLSSIETQIIEQVTAQGVTANDVNFELVSASETQIVVNVTYSFSAQGVSTSSELVYTWDLIAGTGDNSNDGSDDSSDDGDDKVTLPDQLSGKTFNLMYMLINNGGSYADKQKVKFTFSSSNSLFIDIDPEANNGDELQLSKVEKVAAEYIFHDEQNGFKYAVSVTTSGLNEINLSTSEDSFLGQFVEATDDETIENLALVTMKAGTYTIAGEGHSRGTVIIGSDGSVDFDTGVSFAMSDIMAIFDRTNISSEPRVQINYGADDDGPVMNLFLSDDLQSVKSIQYRNRGENIDITVTVETVTGAS